MSGRSLTEELDRRAAERETVWWSWVDSNKPAARTARAPLPEQRSKLLQLRLRHNLEHQCHGASCFVAFTPVVAMVGPNTVRIERRLYGAASDRVSATHYEAVAQRLLHAFPQTAFHDLPGPTAHQAKAGNGPARDLRVLWGDWLPLVAPGSVPDISQV